MSAQEERQARNGAAESSAAEARSRAHVVAQVHDGEMSGALASSLSSCSLLVYTLCKGEEIVEYACVCFMYVCECV